MRRLRKAKLKTKHQQLWAFMEKLIAVIVQ